MDLIGFLFVKTQLDTFPLVHICFLTSIKNGAEQSSQVKNSQLHR